MQATLMVLLIFIWIKHSKLYFTEIKSNLAEGQFDKPVRSSFICLLVVLTEALKFIRFVPSAK